MINDLLIFFKRKVVHHESNTDKNKSTLISKLLNVLLVKNITGTNTNIHNLNKLHSFFLTLVVLSSSVRTQTFRSAVNVNMHTFIDCDAQMS